MGCIYRPTYEAADGTRRSSQIWWLKYRVAGRQKRENSLTENAQEAKRLLKLREGAAAEGRPIWPNANKVYIRELADDLKEEYLANGRKSLERLGFSLAHLLPALGDCKAVSLTTADVTRYRVERQQKGAAGATVNRELAALKRMFRLAIRSSKLQAAPYIEITRERNARAGFFELEQYEAVRRHLPPALRPVVTFAYITGWRVQSEILALEWRQVDFGAGEVRLEPDTTKNTEGRTFEMTPELRACLEAQRALRDRLQREKGAVIPWVFHRAGKPVKDFRGAWKKACAAAGVPGRIPHDFRRTAVRNLERAGVPRSTAMAMVGHKTEAIYRRYAIQDKATRAEGAAKLAAYHAAERRGGHGFGNGDAVSRS